MIVSEDRISEMNDFLNFAQGEWPTRYRARYAQRANRCSRCINSERYIEIQGDQCMECMIACQGSGGNAEGQSGSASLAAQCNELIASYAGQGKLYDALLLFSGGKDSAFLLHHLVTNFPRLRMLAVMVNNGFMSPIAFHNTARVFRRISVDHFVFTPHHTLYETIFRTALLKPGLEGGYETVDRLDGDLTFDICRNIASRIGIPLMVTGLSPEQVERILGVHHFESPREQEEQGRTESAGLELTQILSESDRAYFWQGKRSPSDTVARVLFPFYAWGYHEDQVRQKVIELDLLEPGNENPLATNNELIPIIIARDFARLGYCSFEPEFASLVRQGKADRTFWLNLFEAAEYLCARGQFVPRSLRDTLHRLGLTPEAVGITTLECQ